MLIRIVNNTDGCSIVSKISILHKLKIVSIIAATISVHPFKLNFNIWRFILILWWSAWISGWWFYLTNERFNSHELITRCLNIIIKFAPSILSFVSFKIFLFLFSPCLICLLFLEFRKIYSVIIQFIVNFNIIFFFIYLLGFASFLVKFTVIV